MTLNLNQSFIYYSLTRFIEVLEIYEQIVRSKFYDLCLHNLILLFSHLSIVICLLFLRNDSDSYLCILIVEVVLKLRFISEFY
jgi:hypothetical protein